MGTLHRDSRSNLENLKSCGELSRAEWACMTTALTEIDERFTLTCETTEIAYDDFVRAQEAEYSACLEGDRPRAMEKALDLDVIKVRCD